MRHVLRAAARGLTGILLAAGLATGCARDVRLTPVAPPAACRTAPAGLAGEPVPQTIAWQRPDSSGDRRSLERWCAAVGPPIVVVRERRPHPVDALAIVTWNVHVGGGDVRRLVADLRSGGLTHGTIVRDYVLLLQETFRSGPEVPPYREGFPSPARIAPVPSGHVREDVRSLATGLGVHVFYVPSMRNGGADAVPEDRGSAMLSTVPLARLAALELPFERQRRVTLRAAVAGITSAGRPWSLDLVDAHLENRAGRRRVWIRSGAARTRQARALMKSLPHDRPLVLGGDLNTWLGDEAALRIIAETFSEQAVRKGRAPVRLDYVFASLDPSWRIEQHMVDDWYGSDHHPVVALVTFR